MNVWTYLNTEKPLSDIHWIWRRLIRSLNTGGIANSITTVSVATRTIINFTNNKWNGNTFSISYYLWYQWKKIRLGSLFFSTELLNNLSAKDYHSCIFKFLVIASALQDQVSKVHICCKEHELRCIFKNHTAVEVWWWFPSRIWQQRETQWGLWLASPTTGGQNFHNP